MSDRGDHNVRSVRSFLLALLVFSVGASLVVTTGASAARPSTTAPASAKYHKVAVFLGTSPAKTKSFAIPKGDQWIAQWSFNCTGITKPALVVVGYDGTQADGAISFSRDKRIKAFGRIKSSTNGAFRFRVSSDCTWRIAIYDRVMPVPPVSPNLFASAAMNSYVKSRSGNITAAVYDISTGTTSLYRPGVAEQTASVVKVDILATLLWQQQKLNQTLDADDQQEATGMIEQSDNDDATDLWNAIGANTALGQFNAEIGLGQTTPGLAGEWGATTTTPLDQLSLLKKVALPNSTLSDASRQYELNLMENVIDYDRWGVDVGPSASSLVAIKNGWYPLEDNDWQVNSIGYINGSGRDYLIAVFTTGSANENYGITTIEGMSRIIWNELAASK